MLRAIELAKKAKGKCSPNPLVGAVIVKSDKIVAEGYHKGPGRKHAEIEVIDSLMLRSGIRTMAIDPEIFRNASLYVTLEPCVHYGKTGPCVESVIEAGFKHVFIGMKDPNPLVSGRGVKALKRAGISVTVLSPKSDLAFEVFALNQGFIKSMLHSLPFVTFKAGMSLDARLATSTGASQWITSEEARQDSKLNRSLHDAVLVGSGTVIADNPELATAPGFRSKGLLRVIIDRRLSTDVGAAVYRDQNVFVACTGMASKTAMSRFKKAGIRFKSFGKEDVSVKKLLAYLLREFSVQYVFVEGGSAVNSMFFSANQKYSLLIDQVLYYVAPKILGGSDSIPLFGGVGVRKLECALHINELDVTLLKSNDLKVHGIVNFYQS